MGIKPPKGKRLISINVPEETVQKLQHISHAEKVDYATTYNKAFDKLIELWEKKYGKIKLKAPGKGLESL